MGVSVLTELPCVSITALSLDFVVQAINGNGIDRHMLGWKLSAIETGQNVPELHMDGSYNTGQYYKMSTSQVSDAPYTM